MEAGASSLLLVRVGGRADRVLGRRPWAPNSKCSRGALYTGFSVLVALLLAGQATTAYFLYQQQGRLDKLTVTAQNLQLENLRMKLPKPAKPLNKLRVATPMLMQTMPMQGLLQAPVQNVTKYGNMTQDHVMHMLLEGDPLKVYPQLKGNFPENLKHLKNTMGTLDWKVSRALAQNGQLLMVGDKVALVFHGSGL
ncbi:HLA class II histocompatibility antigen gamma chain [Puma concolor]|uniref:HLA class II histocompatibility antigen gamma chain n=1 Tax=Puma concolor TaxID=9696 RepID=A0A6P6HVS6_PUMCO|nr:HLA class II histocompatibility antigen gamma chain [Puma concolor]